MKTKTKNESKSNAKTRRPILSLLSLSILLNSTALHANNLIASVEFPDNEDIPSNRRDDEYLYNSAIRSIGDEQNDRYNYYYRVSNTNVVERVEAKYLPIALDEEVQEQMANKLEKVFANVEIEFLGKRVTYEEFKQNLLENDDLGPEDILSKLKYNGNPIDFISMKDLLEKPHDFIDPLQPLTIDLESDDPSKPYDPFNPLLPAVDNNPHALGVIATTVVSTVVGTVIGTVVSKVIDRVNYSDPHEDLYKDEWISSGVVEVDNGVFHLSKRFVSNLINGGIISKEKLPELIRYENLKEAIRLNPNLTKFSRERLMEGLHEGTLKIESVDLY